MPSRRVFKQRILDEVKAQQVALSASSLASEILGLPSSAVVAGPDTLPVVQGGSARRVTASALLTYIQSNISVPASQVTAGTFGTGNYTIVGTLTATNLAGTITTASQPNITTMAALTTIGTLVAGTVPAARVSAGTFGAGDFAFGTGTATTTVSVGGASAGGAGRFNAINATVAGIFSGTRNSFSAGNRRATIRLGNNFALSWDDDAYGALRTPYQIYRDASNNITGHEFRSNTSYTFENQDGSATWVTIDATGITGTVLGSAASLTTSRNFSITGDVTASAVSFNGTANVVLSATLGTVVIGKGGTGLTATPTNGQLLIGNGTGYTLAALTAGTGISITGGAGSITISATGGGGSGDVLGPASAVDSNVVAFDGITGKLVKDGGVAVSALLLSSGSYADPAWITSLAWAKLTGVPSTFTPSAHTHPWSDITATPTTIAGYGITDFNALGDARWSLLGHTHTFASITSKPTTLAGYGITDAQALDADLTAIAALGFTATAFLKKTAANTWTLDTATYLTANQSITLSGGATGTGTTAITVTLTNASVTGQALTGYVVGTNTAIAAADTILAAFQKAQGQINARLTANQTITLSGDATGSGATAIAVTLANSGVVAGTYNDVATSVRPFTVDAKGRITSIGAAVTITPAYSSLTGVPATFAPSAHTHPWSDITSNPATTVGTNLYTLVNPSAITFLRVNADNTVTALNATDFRTAIGAGTSSTVGTVTSVSGTGTVSGLTLTGSVTTTGNLTLGGTLAVTAANFASQTANTVLIAPNGVAGVPTFRALLAADIPTLNQSTTGSAATLTTTRTIWGQNFNGSANVTGDLTLGAHLINASSLRVNGYSASWGVTTSITTVGPTVTMGLTTGATWLIAGHSGGAFRAGWQAHDSTNGSSRIYVGTQYTESSAGAGTTLNLANLGTVTATTFVGALTGNASTATSAATWTTARTLTIGATGKSVNGSAAVSWSLAEIGATTVGANLFGLANPSAIRFIQIDALNTVTLLDAAGFRTAIGAGTSSTTGTVTSVSGTGTVSGLSLSGTVTTSGNLTLGGTLAVTAANFASQTANTVLIAPNGVAGVPTFRTLLAADIPTLNQSTTGSAATLTTTRTIWGQNFNGSANVSGSITGATTGDFSGIVSASGLIATNAGSEVTVRLTATGVGGRDYYFFSRTADGGLGLYDATGTSTRFVITPANIALIGPVSVSTTLTVSGTSTLQAVTATTVAANNTISTTVAGNALNITNAAAYSVIGGGASSNVKLYLRGSTGTATTAYGIYENLSYDSTTTSGFYGLRVLVSTQDAIYTTSNHAAIWIDDVIKGAQHTITNAYGLYVTQPTVGSSSNFSIYTTGAVRFGGAVTVSTGGITVTGNSVITGTLGGVSTLTMTGALSGATTGSFSTSVTTPLLIGTTAETRDKLRVWNSSLYAIGFGSTYTFGGLTNYAMTFQTNTTARRGWWWGTDGDTNAQGAMGLTNEGYLTVAANTRIGYGKSDVTAPIDSGHMLDVNGRLNVASGGATITGNSTITGTLNTTGAATFDSTITNTGTSVVDIGGYSTSYGNTASMATAGLRIRMGTSSSATWLIHGMSSATFRGGIQVLDAGGVMRFYIGANFFAAGVGTAALATLNNLDSVTSNTFVGALTGNATTATTLATGRNFSITGDVTATAISFNGSGDVALATTLANSGVVAGTYNNVATEVRPFTVDAKGRITSIGTAVTITATATWASVTGKPTTLAGYSITAADVTAQLLTGYVSGANTALAATDSILAAMGKIQGQINARLSANQTITLSGGATGSGTTAIAVTLTNASVTGQALTGYAVGTNTALAATDTILGAFQKVQGQINARLTANQTITLSGNVTGSGTTAITTTIAAQAVTYARIQNVAANTFLANATGLAATVQEIATNRIPLFASAITGTPSASTYLRGDGSWATPPQGDVVGPASATNLALVAFDGTTGKLVKNTGLVLNAAEALTFAVPSGANGSFVLPEVASSGLLGTNSDGAVWRDLDGIRVGFNDVSGPDSGSPIPRFNQIVSQQTISTTTLQNITGLSFPVPATSGFNRYYWFRAVIWVASAAQTSGPKFAVTWPSGGACSWRVSGPRAANGVDAWYEGQEATSGTAVTLDQVPVVNIRYLYVLEGIYETGTAGGGGNVQVQLAGETASSLTLYMGSHIQFARVWNS